MVAIDDFHDHIKGWWRLALQHALLRAAAARLVVTKGDGLNAADQIGQRWVQHQVIEAVAMGGSDQLHAALGDRSCGNGLSLSADLVDHDHLGHVVLDSLDHHEVLSLWRAHLHASCLADCRMWNVAVTGNLVRGVDYHDALAELRGEDAGRLAEHGGLTNAGATHDQDRSARLDVITEDFNRAEDRAANAAGEANDSIGAITNRGDAMEGALDAGAIITAKATDARDHPVQVFFGDLSFQ